MSSLLRLNYALDPITNLHRWRASHVRRSQKNAKGKFVLTMQKRDSNVGKCVKWWLFTIIAMTILAIIGETMDANGNEI